MRIARSHRFILTLILLLALAVAGGPLLAGCSGITGEPGASAAPSTSAGTSVGTAVTGTIPPVTEPSSEPVRSSQIPVGVPSGPLRLFCTPRTTLNPLLDASDSFQAVSSLVYEGLYGIGEDRLPVPALAAPDSAALAADGLSLTIRIAESRRFHDGTAVRAQDVAAAFAAIQAAGTPSAYAGRVPDISAISAIDDRTLLIMLNRPQPDFAWQLTFPVMPASALAAAAANPLTVLPGTGPYRITGHAAGQGMTLQADDSGERGRNARVRTIEVIELPGLHEALRAFERDQLDLVALPSTSYPAYALRNGLKLERYATGEYVFLSFRTVEGALLANPNRLSFVQAASRAPEISADLETNGIQPAAVPIHPDSPMWRATSLTDPAYLALYHPGTALATTSASPSANTSATAGGSAGTGMNAVAYPATRQALVILAPQADTLRTLLANRLAAVLTARGAAAEARALPEDAYQAARVAGQYDILVAQAVTNGSDDPRWLMGQASDPGVSGSELLPRSGSGGYPAVSAAIDQLFAGGTAAAAERTELLAVLGEASRLGPFTGIGYRYAALASGSRVLGQPRPQASKRYQGIEDLWLWST